MSAKRNRKEFKCLPPEQRQAYMIVEPGTYIPLEISVSHVTCHMTMHVLMYVLIVNIFRVYVPCEFVQYFCSFVSNLGLGRAFAYQCEAMPYQ